MTKYNLPEYPRWTPAHRAECAIEVWRNAPFSVGLGWNDASPTCTCDYREQQIRWLAEYEKGKVAAMRGLK